MPSTTFRVVENPGRIDRIRLSHARSEQAGLTSAGRLRVALEDFDSDSRLIEASRPVLDRLSRALDGLMAGGLLADRNGTIVDRYFGDKRMMRAADGLGAIVGASFDEERTGTNGIAVPLETREPILVCAQEHFLDDLKEYTCYGVPIVNPVSNRLEGVVDLMVERSVPPGVMASMLDQAAEEILSRIVEDYDPSIALSVAAFRRVSRRTRDAVSLLTRDFVMHNLKAADLVVADDADTLRELAATLEPHVERKVELSSGVSVTVTVAPTDVEGSVLLRMDDGSRDRAPIPRRIDRGAQRITQLDRLLARAATTRESTFIVGEQGSGRSRAARLVAQEDPAAVTLDASLETAARVKEVVRQVARSADGGHRVLIIEHAELLEDAACRAIVNTARNDAELRLVVTSTPGFGGRTAVEYMASSCPTWIDIPPLRDRGGDFALVVREILREIASQRPALRDPHRSVTRPALQHLKALPWTGNVAELKSVLETVAERRPVGEIAVTDLPERYRRASGGRANLTPIEQAEKTLIVEALSAMNGNKVQAARHLGISRSKLYDRLKHFRIALP